MPASNICQCLINEEWKTYATDLANAPQSAGIYAVGFLQPVPPGVVETMYVGQINNIHRRLQEHKCQNLAIAQFVKGQFALDGRKNLAIKWVEEENCKCQEGKYLNCMYNKLVNGRVIT